MNSRIARGIATVLLTAGLSWAAAAQAPSPRCLAEALPPLRLIESVSTCGDALETCLESCETGSPEHCLAGAYALQARDDAARAHALFRRACRLGIAVACTNWGAGVWSGKHDDADLSCVGRVFEAACSVGEHFACGMASRLAFGSAESESDYARVRTDLEAACSRVGGFSCRVLAKYLETGKLGPYEREAITELLARACEGGDSDACGQPETADETFH